MPLEGILTLESGNIQIFNDRDVLVAQSRIMTEQGGSILMWSSNGNLDAGEGAKTSVSAPPPKSSCDVDHRCSADIKGDPGALEFQQQSGLSHHRRGHRLRRQRRGSEFSRRRISKTRTMTSAASNRTPTAPCRFWVLAISAPKRSNI